MPSGVTSPASLWICCNRSSRRLSITPWTPVTQTYSRCPSVIHRSRMSSVRSMSRTFTRTPRTSIAGATSLCPAEAGLHVFSGDGIDDLSICCKGGGHLCLDPAVGARDAFLERNLRLPAEHLTQPRVVGVAAADALRTGNVHLRDSNACRIGDEIGQRVDADQPVLPEIEWAAI